MKKIMKQGLCLILALAMLLAMPACGSTASEDNGSADDTNTKPITIKVACTQSAEDDMAKYLQKFMNEVSSRYSGEINWEFYPNGELGTLNDVMEQAMAGGNIIMSQGIEWMANFVPDASVLQCPYLFNSVDEAVKVAKSDWFADLKEDAKQNDAIILSANWVAGVRCMISRDFPINIPSDMSGKILRCPGSTLYTAMASYLGYSPTTSNWNEVYTGLSQKTFDAAEANIALLYTSSLYEVADYLNLTYHITMVTCPVMGKKFLDTLPAELQEILYDVSEEIGDQYTEKCLSAENEAIEKFRAAGTTIVEPDVAAFQEACKEIFHEPDLNWSPDLYDTIQEILAS